MVAWFYRIGTVNPVRFRIVQGEESTTAIIDKVIRRGKEKLAGNYRMVFKCHSLINEVEKIYEIKYVIDTCK